MSVKAAAAVADTDARIGKIRRVAMKNLNNTLRIMWFMNGNGLRLYRFASHLVPLATHEMTRGWEWWEDGEIRDVTAKIGEAVRRFGFRVSMHLPGFCVMTSDETKFKAVTEYMGYFMTLFRLMGVDNPVVVTHVGGKYGNTEDAMKRMEANYLTLPEPARKVLVLENDDTTYGPRETLEVCRRLGLPMVLDIHHFQCLNDGGNLGDLIPEVFSTWEGFGRPPKIHVSSPKSDKEPKAHADFVDPVLFLEFAGIALGIGDFDVMVEAKMKDVATMKLLESLPEVYRPV